MTNSKLIEAVYELPEYEGGNGADQVCRSDVVAIIQSHQSEGVDARSEIRVVDVDKFWTAYFDETRLTCPEHDRPCTDVFRDAMEKAIRLYLRTPEQPQEGRVGGYAPGTYMCRCFDCGAEFTGDKRASQCLKCAQPDKAEKCLCCGSNPEVHYCSKCGYPDSHFSKTQPDKAEVVEHNMKYLLKRLRHDPEDDWAVREAVAEILEATNRNAALSALPQADSGLLKELADLRAELRHFKGRPAVDGKPLELQSRDELLAAVRELEAENDRLSFEANAGRQAEAEADAEAKELAEALESALGGLCA